MGTGVGSVAPSRDGGLRIKANTIFINESGLYSLILSSKLSSAREFKRWVTSEVLPSIRKSGSYKAESNNIINNDLLISDYYNKPVIYIANIGEKEGKVVYKYGKSEDFSNRYESHKGNFNKFSLVYIKISNNILSVEQKFKEEMRKRTRNITYKVNGHNYTELFYTDNNFSLDDAKSIMDNIIKNSKSENESEIRELKLELKMKEFELKNKELELRNKDLENQLITTKMNILKRLLKKEELSSEALELL